MGSKALIDKVLLNGVICLMENSFQEHSEQADMVVQKIKQAIIDAPLGVIALDEMPTRCKECPAHQYDQHEEPYCGVTGEENPTLENCPIVFKDVALKHKLIEQDKQLRSKEEAEEKARWDAIPEWEKEIVRKNNELFGRMIMRQAETFTGLKGEIENDRGKTVKFRRFEPLKEEKPL